MEYRHERGKPGSGKKKIGEGSADIEQLLGIAMGCIGMSMDDFCRCTPSWFYKVYEAWHEREQRLEQAGWERTRMQCLCMLQPYSKKKLQARDVMQFPWEVKSEEGRVKNGGGRVKNEIPLSREALMERYRKAKERVGLK